VHGCNRVGAGLCGCNAGGLPRVPAGCLPPCVPAGFVSIGYRMQQTRRGRVQRRVVVVRFGWWVRASHRWTPKGHAQVVHGSCQAAPLPRPGARGSGAPGVVLSWVNKRLKQWGKVGWWWGVSRSGGHGEGTHRARVDERGARVVGGWRRDPPDRVLTNGRERAVRTAVSGLLWTVHGLVARGWVRAGWAGTATLSPASAGAYRLAGRARFGGGP
jgi:hypothetical protein